MTNQRHYHIHRAQGLAYGLNPQWFVLCVCVVSHFSHVRLFATPWTVARQAPLSMGFSRQEYWSGLPCPPPGTFLTVFNTMIDVILNAIKQKKKKKERKKSYTSWEEKIQSGCS